MSKPRSQKRKNNDQDSAKDVTEGLISPVVIGNSGLPDQEVLVAGPSSAKSPRIARIEHSVLENLRTSLEQEISSVKK